MIADTLDHAGQYAGLHERLDRGLAWLRNTDLGALPEGRHEIDGADLYATIGTYNTEPPSAKQLEAHRKYLDIQVVVAGSEALYWCPLGALSEVEAFSAAKDVGFYAGAEGTAIPLQPGDFVVLFPQDAHKPGCVLDRPESVRKLVVKVRVG